VRIEIKMSSYAFFSSLDIAYHHYPNCFQVLFVLIITFYFRYPNARQYKTVASALVKSYPFLESSTDGGEVSDFIY
jgi:hypothetical protein